MKSKDIERSVLRISEIKEGVFYHILRSTDTSSGWPYTQFNPMEKEPMIEAGWRFDHYLAVDEKTFGLLMDNGLRGYICKLGDRIHLYDGNHDFRRRKKKDQPINLEGLRLQIIDSLSVEGNILISREDINRLFPYAQRLAFREFLESIGPEIRIAEEGSDVKVFYPVDDDPEGWPEGYS